MTASHGGVRGSCGCGVCVVAELRGRYEARLSELRAERERQRREEVTVSRSIAAVIDAWEEALELLDDVAAGAGVDLDLAAKPVPAIEETVTVDDDRRITWSQRPGQPIFAWLPPTERLIGLIRLPEADEEGFTAIVYDYSGKKIHRTQVCSDEAAARRFVVEESAGVTAPAAVRS